MIHLDTFTSLILLWRERKKKAGAVLVGLGEKQNEANNFEKHRVHGTKKLHVVDAGILPIQTTSHMMSVLYSMAGRAADVIHECGLGSS